VTWFEPDPPDPASGTMSAVHDQPPRPAGWAWRLAAPAVTLVLGMVLGFALGAGRSGGEPASGTAPRPPATQPVPAPVTSVVVRPTASSACLETAARADQILDLLIRNRRSEAADLLQAYTIASRQCRRDASP
jgi:hypothetical protein